MRYIIPELPPSINKYIGKTNVWEYQADKKEYARICRYYCKTERPNKHINLTIVFHFPDKKKRDYDNYLKMLLDGLVYAGVIKDDSWVWCSYEIKGTISENKKGYVEVITED